jgi:hypothetical protein
MTHVKTLLHPFRTTADPPEPFALASSLGDEGEVERRCFRELETLLEFARFARS